jgi:hypothetical protein
MELEDLKKAFDKHTEDEMKRYDALHYKLDALAENHLGHLQTSLASLEAQLKPIITDHPSILASLTSLKEKMTLVLWVGGILGAAIILSLTAAIMTLILK